MIQQVLDALYTTAFLLFLGQAKMYGLSFFIHSCMFFVFNLLLFIISPLIRFL